MKHTLFDTYFGKSYNLENLAKKAGVLLQSEMKMDMDQLEYVQLISTTKPVVHTPMSKAFELIVNEKLLNCIYYISLLSKKLTDIPEVLTIPEVTIYGKHVSGIHQKELKRSWANMSTVLSRPRDRYGKPFISGVNETMSIVVRSILSMAYDDNEHWLNGKGRAFLIDFYAKSMSSILNRYYSFDVQEGALVRYAFAYYYASLLDNRKGKNGEPEVLNRCGSIFQNGLIDKDKMDNLMTGITKSDEPTMEHVVKFIAEYGPDRAKNISSKIIYQALLSTSRSSIATLICADYPPYLLYMILRVVSNDKHPLFTNVLNNMYTRQQVTAEINSILEDKSTFSGVDIYGH